MARLLERAYGRPRLTRLSDPLDELVGTILSQNTSDTNSDRAYAQLREAFPTWEVVLAAPLSRVAAAIRTGGLATIKARRIKAALRWVRAQRGRLDLRFLRRLSLEQGRRVLEGQRHAGR